MSAPGRLPLIPAGTFVLVWSSGYIAGPAAVHAAAPFSVLGIRFVLAALVGAAVAVALKRPMPRDRGVLFRLSLVGLTMNAVQFSAMYVAFDRGLGATLGSLFHSLSPVLTVLFAAALLSERISAVQVVGFLVGVIGVVVVLGPDLSGAGGALGVLFGALSMLALSLGTLGQRWIGARPDPIWAATFQFAVSAPPMLVAGVVFEGTSPVEEWPKFLISLFWLAVVNSIVGLLLLARLVHAGGASAAGSLFFLSPPVTGVLAWLVLGQGLGLREIIGLVIAMIGVGAATWVGPRARAVPVGPGETPAEVTRD